MAPASVASSTRRCSTRTPSTTCLASGRRRSSTQNRTGRSCGLSRTPSPLPPGRDVHGALTCGLAPAEPRSRSCRTQGHALQTSAPKRLTTTMSLLASRKTAAGDAFPLVPSVETRKVRSMKRTWRSWVTTSVVVSGLLIAPGVAHAAESPRLLRADARVRGTALHAVGHRLGKNAGGHSTSRSHRARPLPRWASVWGTGGRCPAAAGIHSSGPPTHCSLHYSLQHVPRFPGHWIR
jgi:hypothetical protein